MDATKKSGRGGLARRLGALGFGLALALVGAELLLRVVTPPAEAFRIWQPHLERRFQPSPDLMPGVSGPSRFSINSLGFRGDEPSSSHEFRILCLGGSTTECLYLDQSEAWPQLLQSRLRERTDRQVWVANGGRSGHSMRMHRFQVEHLLQQEPRFDAVVMLVGVNDLGLRLAHDTRYDPGVLRRDGSRRRLTRASFQVLPEGMGRDPSWYARFALGRFARRLGEPIVATMLAQDSVGTIYRTWRSHRQETQEMREALPELESGLLEFRESLKICSDAAKAHGTRLVLLTQPSLWSEDLAPELERLLWMGGVGRFQQEPGMAYYSAGALAEGMRRYNEALIEVADREGVEVIDLAEQLPRDTTAFYDDVHFNEEGCRKVAELVAEHFAARQPFGGG